MLGKGLPGGQAVVTGSCHTHLARSWLGTEDLDCVMSLDEDIGAALGTKSPQGGYNTWNTSAALPRCQALF